MSQDTTMDANAIIDQLEEFMAIDDWSAVYMPNLHTAITDAIKLIKLTEEMRTAYESDYQIQDVIEVCVEYWG